MKCQKICGTLWTMSMVSFENVILHQPWWQSFSNGTFLQISVVKYSHSHIHNLTRHVASDCRTIQIAMKKNRQSLFGLLFDKWASNTQKLPHRSVFVSTTKNHQITSWTTATNNWKSSITFRGNTKLFGVASIDKILICLFKPQTLRKMNEASYMRTFEYRT